MIGGAPYGHSAVLRAILAAERRGSHQPARETPGNGSAGAASLVGSRGDERDPRAYRDEPDGERPTCRSVTLEDVGAMADPEHASAALDQNGRRPLPEIDRR